MDINQEVKDALKNNKPVVALESTIISHGNHLNLIIISGMEYPQNKETALAVEAVVRENGAIPATIAILDGRIKIGTEFS
jgi:pseudouridylate synthase